MRAFSVGSLVARKRLFASFLNSRDARKSSSRTRRGRLQAYCFGDGKLCCLGRNTGYASLEWPDVDPLDIPLDSGEPIFAHKGSNGTLLEAGNEACHSEHVQAENLFPNQSSDDAFSSSASSQPPLHASLGHNARVVAASGWAHSAVVSSFGELWVWGRTHDMRNILRVNRKSQLTSWLMGTGRSVDAIDPAPVEVPGVGVPLPRGDGEEPLDAEAYSLQLRGSENSGEPLSFDDRVVGVACSAALTGCFTESGKAFLFGDNRVGQCGNGNPSEREWNPVRLRGLPEGERVTSIALGYQHGLVATASGRVYAWGKGDRGQLGIGGKRTENKATPLPLFDKAPVRVPTMSEMNLHAAALRRDASKMITEGEINRSGFSNTPFEDGAIHADQGEKPTVEKEVYDEESSTENKVFQSDFHTDNTSVGKLVLNEEGLIQGERPRAVDVGCGFAHSAALSSEGTLWVWGKFMAVHFSDDGSRLADEYVPRKLNIPAPVVQFACGQFHTAALDATGRIWLVGMRSKSEVSSAAEAIDRFCPEPYEVPGASKIDVAQMRGGWNATTLIDTQGRLYEVSFNGIQGPSEDFESIFVHDVAPGFKHTVVVGEDRV